MLLYIRSTSRFLRDTGVFRHTGEEVILNLTMLLLDHVSVYLGKLRNQWESEPVTSSGLLQFGDAPFVSLHRFLLRSE
jgi:hypothetical protein